MSDISGGATGGVMLKKEVYDRRASQGSFDLADFGFGNEYEDELTSTNDTGGEFLMGATAANPRHVAHNHSYPLQPGQTPKERKLTPEERRATAQMTRDEKKARALKIPFSMDDMIHSPVEEFNDMLSQHKLSDKQLQLIRDIRRRGKNKGAAQNCRKRKMEAIQGLEDNVQSIRQEKDRLQRENNRLNKAHTDWTDKYEKLYEEVFRSLRDDNGQPYDPSRFTLQQTADGNVFLLPISEANQQTPQRDHDEKATHKRKGGSKKR